MIDSSSNLTYTTGTGGCGMTCVSQHYEAPKVTPLMKHLLSEDTQKFIRAGFLTEKLELTYEGKEALWALLFEANKAELMKIAEAKIDEDYGF